MITVTGTAQHEAWRDRVLPPVEQVRSGLWSIPTPFPDSPLRYVLAYLIETRGGLALVDTGWPSDDSWDGLVAGVRETGHDVADVTAVLVTHSHADHFGLASRVREASGARVALHRLDAASLDDYASMNQYAGVARDWLHRRGVPESERAGMSPNAAAVKGPISRMGRPDVLLEDGDYPMGAGTGLRVLWTPGHSPGHVCFVHEEHDLLLSGDHVLPRISPNISPAPANEDDTLGDYLGSLAAMADLDVDEVLPAHEYRFKGLPARVRQLQEHHAARLAEILAVIRPGDGPTTLEVAERLTWSRPWEQSQGIIRRSAIGETYAHLVHLVRLGQVVNSEGEIDRWLLNPAQG